MNQTLARFWRVLTEVSEETKDGKVAVQVVATGGTLGLSLTQWVEVALGACGTFRLVVEMWP